MLLHVAPRVGKVRQRQSPAAGVRLCCHALTALSKSSNVEVDVSGDVASGPDPTPDPLLSPFQRYHTSSGGIELGPKCVLGAFDCATFVVVGFIPTVLCPDGAGQFPADALHVAALCGVKRNKIAVCALVYRLHDVNLSVGRPGARRRIGEPKGRPGTASHGGVLDVKDEKTRFVLAVGFQTDGVSPSGGIVTRSVDPDVDGVLVGGGEVVEISIPRRDVVYETMGW